MATKTGTSDDDTPPKQPGAGAAMFDAQQLAAAVRDSAQQIWLAGMGAFAKAQAEGGKVFEALVRDGTSLQRKTRAEAAEKMGEAAGMAAEAGAKAGASWDRLENIFEDRTAKALAKLGVPTARQVDDLTRRVDALAAALEKLSAAAPAESAPAKKAPAKKAAARAARTTPVAAAKKPARKAAAKSGG